MNQIQGFDVPVDHLYASSVFINYIRSLNLEDIVIATPDVGGTKQCRLCQILRCTYGYLL